MKLPILLRSFTKTSVALLELNINIFWLLWNIRLKNMMDMTEIRYKNNYLMSYILHLGKDMLIWR